MASALGESQPSKKVLITGVSKGLGRALALELANRGHTIIGCSRDQTKLDSLHEQLSKSSLDQHFLFQADVKSNNSVQELARNVAQRKLVPDIIVNNAALINKNGKIWEVDVQEFDNVIDTNVKGIANVLRHFLPLMISNERGIIINMSSIVGRNAHKYVNVVSPYIASKYAVEGLSKSVAKELPEGIAIVALDPGAIYTDMAVSFFGDQNLASKLQSPERWAARAATMILNLTTSDNGTSLTLENPMDLSIV